MWLVRDGLRPVPQYWIEDSRGRLARAALAFPEQQVAIEYDGSRRDGELWALNRDRERLDRVQAAGWEVVFVTAPLLAGPWRMVRTVRAALARRWPKSVLGQTAAKRVSKLQFVPRTRGRECT